jgi:hypothetical protein
VRSCNVIGAELAPSVSTSAFRLATASCEGRRELVHLAAVGHQIALLAGVGEERHRCFGVDQDQVLQAGQLHARELCEVRQPLDRRDTRAALQTRRKDLGEQLRAGRRRDAAGGGEPRLAQRTPAEQERDVAAAAQHLCDLVDHTRIGDGR